MNITFYKNENGKFTDVSKEALPYPSSGWWNCISGVDIDDDGDTDYICGNLGLNSIYQGDEAHPLSIYAKDYDLNGIVDPVIVKFMHDKNFDLKEYPIGSRDDLIMQISILRQRMPTFRAFGEATVYDLFTPEELADSYKKEAVLMASSVLINDGTGKFTIKHLPNEAQIAPVFGIITQDFDTDGNTDLLLVGNDYAMDLMSGRIDASNGMILLGKGDGSFKSLKPYESGFLLKGDVKGVAVLFDKKGNELIVSTQNKDSLVSYQYAKIPLTTDPKEAQFAEIKLNNGKTRKQEFYHGTSFLSQSSSKMIIQDYYKEIILFDVNGESKEVSFK
jgi:hypothetical protein